MDQETKYWLACADQEKMRACHNVMAYCLERAQNPNDPCREYYRLEAIKQQSLGSRLFKQFSELMQ